MPPEPLLAPSFLFRFSVPLRSAPLAWSEDGFELDETYRLPSFGELEERPLFGDLRAAWTPNGLFFSLRVAGKRQTPWCRSSRIAESDGLQLWIDTRDTHTIHRAGRFCHRFAFLPAGNGRLSDQPIAAVLPIHRAREHPKPLLPDAIYVRSEKRVDGYVLQALIETEALTGFDPEDQPRMGFSYAVVDRELGWQTFSVGPELPFMEDPSLWGTLELVH